MSAEAALAEMDAERIAAVEERKVSDEAAATWARLLAEEQIKVATTRQALASIEGMAGAAGPGEVRAAPIASAARRALADTGGDTAATTFEVPTA